jgi:hypothetical protein
MVRTAIGGRARAASNRAAVASATGRRVTKVTNAWARAVATSAHAATVPGGARVRIGGILRGHPAPRQRPIGVAGDPTPDPIRLRLDPIAHRAQARNPLLSRHAATTSRTRRCPPNGDAASMAPQGPG